jgi:hypothetical protein
MVCPDFGQAIIYPYLHPLSGADEVMGSHGSSSLLFAMKVMVWHFMSDSLKVMTALIVVVLDLWLWRCLCSFIDMVYWHVVTCSDCMSFSLLDPKKCLNVRHMLCVLAKETNCQITYITSLDKGNEHCGIADSIILQFSRFIACPNILHVCKSSIGHLSTGLKSQPQVYAYFLVQHNTLCNQFQCHYCVGSPL